jgi:hypothetical protein
MIDEFARLKARLAREESIYYETLSQFGVQHSNEFPKNEVRKAAAAYQKLLARVLEYEAAQQSAEESATTALIEEIKPPDEEAIV